MTGDELRAFKERHNLRNADIAWIVSRSNRCVDYWLAGINRMSPITNIILQAFDEGKIDARWIMKHSKRPPPP